MGRPLIKEFRAEKLSDRGVRGGQGEEHRSCSTRGRGRPMIAVMLIRETGRRAKESATVYLVHQVKCVMSYCVPWKELKFSVSYLTGGNSSKDALTAKVRRTTLNMFRSGKVNFMFTTDVAEEGIHVRNCSFVIRFDLPKTVRSYVQSRGRARHHDSQYILMIERGNADQIDQLFGIIRSELFLKCPCSPRDPLCFTPKVFCEELNAYVVESTGATVTADSSISLIYKYCEKLPGDRFFIPQPTFQVHLKDGLYECVLTLPPNAVFRRIVGPPSINAHVAKQFASLEACKKLHKMNALDDHLLPFFEEPLGTSTAGINKEYAAKAGTTKRKEFHGITRACALSGTWAHKPDNVTLNAYGIKFVCDQEGESYSGFVLLLEASLDSDIAGAEIELFLIPNKVVKSSVFPCGKVQLSADQVEKSKLFEEFFFNGIFGKLITGSKSSGIRREFLFKEGKRLSWSSTNIYLLLPLEPSSS
ncbi:uncharacterized protein A4U43_C04F34330 [Asparagus officinalis]|uniref:Helicase C-terminal domain-containing protein n=1 Tax=Asparagus officinalis TaxID=4686 RepID=A0A5P1F8H5_ASPOF|nr:uncharacterized protein A4U43_C04F34330 [Asparagus officinalis]